jgi:hypothetical protein
VNNPPSQPAPAPQYQQHNSSYHLSHNPSYPTNVLPQVGNPGEQKDLLNIIVNGSESDAMKQLIGEADHSTTYQQQGYANYTES